MRSPLVDGTIPRKERKCFGQGPRYHAFLAFSPHEGLSPGSCMSIDDPGGAIGVYSKKNSPSHAAHADILGFMRYGRTMLTERSHWSISRHQYAMGKSGGSDAMMDLKQALYVCTALSAGLQCLPGAEYCRSVCWLAMNSSTSADVSLSILCSVGLNPLASHQLYTFLYAANSSDLWRDLIGTPFMKLGSKMSERRKEGELYPRNLRKLPRPYVRPSVHGRGFRTWGSKF